MISTWYYCSRLNPVTITLAIFLVVVEIQNQGFQVLIWGGNHDRFAEVGDGHGMLLLCETWQAGKVGKWRVVKFHLIAGGYLKRNRGRLIGVYMLCE